MLSLSPIYTISAIKSYPAIFPTQNSHSHVTKSESAELADTEAPEKWLSDESVKGRVEKLQASGSYPGICFLTDQGEAPLTPSTSPRLPTKELGRDPPPKSHSVLQIMMSCLHLHK